MNNRIVRHNGFIVREMDVVNHLVGVGHSREIALRIAAKAPEWNGNPLSGNQYTAAVDRMNRRDEIAVMQAE